MKKRTLLLTGVSLLFPAGQALAQEAPSVPATARAASGESAARSEPSASAAQPLPDDAGEDEDIVITGQRARGSVVGDIPPQNTLNARDVRATGATNITELLQAIAPEIGSARGRGGGQPVMLLNGLRISGFRELRDIPTEAIQRVEILPEEVALKYGYRADQKVVNIVLRQRFRSTTTQVGAGIATEGGYLSGNADLTRFLVQRNGRTTYNLHVEGNGMITEAERNLIVDPGLVAGTTDQQLAARSLIGAKRDVRGSATFNRQVFGTASGTLNTELEHQEGHSLIGLNPSLFEPLARTTSSDSAHVGAVLNGTTKSQWRWTLTGNGDLDHNRTRTDRTDATFPIDRASQTIASADVKGTANGNMFALPAGNASATFNLEGSTVHLDSSRSRAGVRSSDSLSRTSGIAGVNVDLPISRRNRDFSALGNLTLNANAEIDQLSDFGTLTTIGAGANWSPVDRLTFIASWTREEGPPTINQLGDPLLETPGARIFDFTTGQTALVTAITGGNPELRSDRRSVVKLSTNWQPMEKADLRLRAEYVHQSIDRPIGNISVTSAFKAVFPERFVCQGGPCSSGFRPLLSVDLRPVNFDRSRRDSLRVGFDFSQPLKSRRPSQAVMDQIRQQFGFGNRGLPGGANGATPGAGGTPPDGARGGRRGGFGGGRGGGGGGFFGGQGGNNRGRVQFSLTDTITFVDKVRIAPGLPEVDYLHGDAAGASGGTPQHRVEAQLGYFNNGLGARLGANWRSGTSVNTLTGDNLRFSPLSTFDLRLFANPGDIPELTVKHPWLRGTQVRLEFNNVFNSRPRVRDAAGNVPLNYQPDLLDPLGRTIMISFRKLFLPSPATMRRLFQQDRPQGSPTR